MTIIRKTRVVDDWQKFLPNRVSEDDPSRAFLRECGSKYDIAVCFPTSEEKQKMVEEFREGSEDARGKLEYALLISFLYISVTERILYYGEEVGQF